MKQILINLKLPLVTGHEIVGLDLESNRMKITDINSSHLATNQHKTGHYCNYCTVDKNMHIHCPKRMTLGIDRLQGNF